MSRTLHKVNAKTVQSATKPSHLGDGGGLDPCISPTGLKSWGLIYSRHGKRSELGLGAGHRVAREKRSAERDFEALAAYYDGLKLSDRNSPMFRSYVRLVGFYREIFELRQS